MDVKHYAQKIEKLMSELSIKPIVPIVITIMFVSPSFADSGLIICENTEGEISISNLGICPDGYHAKSQPKYYFESSKTEVKRTEVKSESVYKTTDPKIDFERRSLNEKISKYKRCDAAKKARAKRVTEDRAMQNYKRRGVLVARGTPSTPRHETELRICKNRIKKYKIFLRQLNEDPDYYFYEKKQRQQNKIPIVIGIGGGPRY